MLISQSARHITQGKHTCIRVVYFAMSEAFSVSLPKGNAVTRVDRHLAWQLAMEWCKGGGMCGGWVVVGWW
jgi:hypothetical protein